MDIFFLWLWRGIVAVFKAINSILSAGDQAILTLIGRPPEISPEARSKFLGFWDRTRDPLEKGVILFVRIVSIIAFASLVWYGVPKIYETFHRGPASELTNPKYQSEIPTIEATPGEPFRKIQVEENWLTILQAQDLQKHPGINLVEVNPDGTVRYSASQSTTFTGQSPWIQAGKPGNINGLSLEGTSVVLTIYGHDVRIYIGQPFFLAGDKNGTSLPIYVVDQHGQLWMTNDSHVLIPLKDTHSSFQLRPDPLLTPGS